MQVRRNVLDVSFHVGQVRRLTPHPHTSSHPHSPTRHSGLGLHSNNPFQYQSIISELKGEIGRLKEKINSEVKKKTIKRL